MNIGTTIALIYFVIIVFYVGTYLYYYIMAFFPTWVWGDACPDIYKNILLTIHNILDIIFRNVFIIVTVVLVILYMIWLILKSLPWPLGYLKKTPPLGDLEKAGIFALIDRLGKVIFSFKSPKDMLKQSTDAVGTFIRSFMIDWSKDRNPRLYQILTNTLPDGDPPRAEMSNNSGGERPKEKDESKEKMMSKMDKIIDEELKTCILQNKKSITSDMSYAKVQQIQGENKIAEIQCRLKTLPNRVKINVNNI